jgi:hypothetical protein
MTYRKLVGSKLAAAASPRSNDDAPLDDETATEAQAAPSAGSLPASVANKAGPRPNTYPIRWLRGRHPLSLAAAKIIAGELRWLEAA